VTSIYGTNAILRNSIVLSPIQGVKLKFQITM